MTQTSSPALQVALAYYEAWTSKDIDRAMTYIADNILCDAPAGRIDGIAAYRDFLAPFMIAAFGDDRTALVMYDTATIPVASAPAAECVTVADGKITHSRFIFDRAPFEAARNAAATG